MKVIGIVDDVTTCECCGRTGLKRTVALEDSMGNVEFFGTTCAAHKISGNRTQKTVNRIIDQGKFNGLFLETLRKEGRDKALERLNKLGVFFKCGLVNRKGKFRYKAPWDADWSVGSV